MSFIVKNRVGEININNQGLYMEIISYKNSHDIDVKFETGNIVRHRKYENFKNGKCTDNTYSKLFNNDIYRKVYDKDSDSYRKWIKMMGRCYNEKTLERQPTYKDVDVCEEWFTYDNFKKWYDENYYEIPNKKMCLDKDLFSEDTKKIYSPNTCCFLPSELNMMFVSKPYNKKYNTPIGVKYDKDRNKYLASMEVNGKNKFLGRFNTPDDAFNAYKKAKEIHIKELANKYKEYMPNYIYQKLINYELKR